MNKKSILEKLLLLVCSIPLILLSVYCGIHIHDYSEERADIKKDYSEIHSIEYGILSVDAWKANIEDILSNRIQDFELTADERKALEAEITDVLKKIISETDSVLRSNHTLKGKITMMAYKTFVNKEALVQKTPMFSHVIAGEILKPKNKERIKQIALEKIEEYASQTHGDSSTVARIDSILTKYHASNVNDFDKKNKARINFLEGQTYILTFVVLGIILLFLLAWFLVHRLKDLQRLFFILSVLLALSALLVGLTSPMIEIDARIKKIDFLLMGEHISFNDQVIFYQSKSILQVVEVLIRTEALDSATVGILILVFSIVFPITKLISTQIYLLGDEKTKKNKFIYYFAILSGKWSMADVMVVAIFMAYVGFKGILDHQLQAANFNTPSLSSITTNLTSLQPAYALFVAFVIYGLILSEILKRIHSKKDAGAEVEA